MELVSTREEVAENLLVFDGYRSSSNPAERRFHHDLLKHGHQFVAGPSGDKHIFAPSRFVGYSGCSRRRHMAFAGKDGRLTTPALSKILKQPIPSDELEAEYLLVCQSLGVKPDRRQRSYWPLVGDLGVSSVLRYEDNGFPNEVREYIEGATTQALVNVYERDPKAREKCLELYGHDCAVCGFNFERTFGEIGHSFAHVHHLKPISKIKQPQAVDPREDLRPVCPNCHAMLHQSDPPFTIDELKQIMLKAAGQNVERRGV